MGLETVVVTNDDLSKGIVVGGVKMVPTLGEREEEMGATLNEILRAVTEAVTDGLSAEATLTVELDASVQLKASGGIKYLILNIGGSRSKTDTVKIKLETTVLPRKTT